MRNVNFRTLRRSARLWVLLAATPVACTSVDAPGVVGEPDAAPLQTPISIPFRLEGGQIIVDNVRVNGSGPYSFQLDTGAEGHGRVDVQLATDLDLEASGRVDGDDTSGREGMELRQYELALLELGGLSFRDLTVYSRDYNSERAVAARGTIHGILGFGLFERYVLTLDYPRRKLLLTNASLPEPDGKRIVAADAESPVPAIAMQLGGVDGTAFLDTGAMPDITVSSELAAGLEFLSPPVVVGRAASVAGQFEISMGVLDGALGLAGQRIDEPRVFVGDGFERIIIGAPILSRFVLTFDQRNARIRIADAVDVHDDH